MATDTFVDGEIYGGRELNKPATITDVILTEDKEGNPVLNIYVDVGHRANNPRNPTEGGGEPIPPGEEMTRLFLGQDDDEKTVKRRKIALDQLAAILDMKLEDNAETILRFLPDVKESLAKKMIGKQVWLRGAESGGRVYLNVFIPRQKPQALTIKSLRAKLKGRAKPNFDSEE